MRFETAQFEIFWVLQNIGLLVVQVWVTGGGGRHYPEV